MDYKVNNNYIEYLDRKLLQDMLEDIDIDPDDQEEFLAEWGETYE